MIKTTPKSAARRVSRIRPQGIRAVDGKRSISDGRSRRVRRVLTAAFALALIAECAAGALTSPWFYVRDVRVSGLGGLPAAEAHAVLNASRIDEKTGLANIPAAEIEDELERQPWIARAQVSRRLPGTIIVNVIPRIPFALMLTGGRHWAVDAGGIVIRRTEPHHQIPLIEVAGSVEIHPGQRIVEESFVQALSVARSLRAIHVPRIAKIVVDSQAHLCLNMSDGIAIRLGQSDEMDAKLALVEKIYREEPEVASRVEAIDLTAPDHPSCRPLSERVRKDRGNTVSDSKVHRDAARAETRSQPD